MAFNRSFEQAKGSSLPPETHERLGRLKEHLEERERLPELVRIRRELKRKLEEPDLSVKDQLALKTQLRDINKDILGIVKPEKYAEKAYEKLAGEFDRQLSRIITQIEARYPDRNDGKAKEYTELLTQHAFPIKERLRELAAREFPEGHTPFVFVVRDALIPLKEQISLVESEGKEGFTALDLSEFKTAEGVEIPESMAYLAVDIENGKVMLGKSADEAVKQFKKEGRSPLTAEEGIAIILQHPEILKDHYMDLPGSRRGDGRVADLWLVEGKPGLSWSWASSSHAEWGSASCGSRVGP